MTEEQKAQEAQVNANATGQEAKSAGGESVPDWVKDPNKAYEEIKKAREEAKAHRVKALEVEQRLQAIEDAKKAQAESEAKAKGDYQALLEQRERELADIKTRYEAERLSGLKARIGAEMGLPVALADRLQGATEEDIRKDAESLKSLVPTQENKSKGSTVTSPAGSAKTGETYQERKARIYGRGGSSFG